jgi:hypothetical protein
VAGGKRGNFAISAWRARGASRSALQTKASDIFKPPRKKTAKKRAHADHGGPKNWLISNDSEAGWLGELIPRLHVLDSHEDAWPTKHDSSCS